MNGTSRDTTHSARPAAERGSRHGESGFPATTEKPSSVPTSSGSGAGTAERPRNQGDLVVVVEDDRRQRLLFQRWLERAGYRVEGFDDGESCLAGLRQVLPSAVVLDLHLPGISGQKTLETIKARHPRVPVVILTADSDVSHAVAAMKSGAYDYLVKPVERVKLQTLLRNAVEKNGMSLKITELEREAQGPGYPEIVGDSPPMRDLFRQLDRIAPSDVTVLIHGETGSGKELVARALHSNSGWRKGRFVAINCAAIPETLQESELFGHEKGAFTGATSRSIGRFEEAHEGTLFLDEVAELSPSLQAKLLRVLQDGVTRRLGGHQDIPSNFRLLAATHRDLAEEVEKGRFREDLFFRIAVFELGVPPLRCRTDDIPLLVEALVPEATPFRVSEEAMELLTQYPWPGNVRELQNAIQRAVVVAADGVVQPDDLPPRIVRYNAAEPGPLGGATSLHDEPSARPPVREAHVPLLDDVERSAIENALHQQGGNLSKIARKLGIGRATLYRKLKKYGLQPPGASLPPRDQEVSF